MFRTTIAGLGFFALSLFLGACEPIADPAEEAGRDTSELEPDNRAASTPASPAAQTIVGNPAHNAFAAMPEGERRIAFQQFMQGSGEECSMVQRTFYQGRTPNGEAFWNIECTGGTEWAIMVQPDTEGSTQLLECELMRALAGSACWEAFET